MGMKSYRPLTPILRYKTTNTNEQITTDVAYKPLLVAQKRGSGRNNLGRITVRHHGGGARHFYRIIDFKRDKVNIPGTIETIEYDPNRTSFIALVKYPDGERRYILATTNMKPGMKIIAAPECEIAEGNCMPMKNIPVGMSIHNIEMREKKGGQLVRTAGAAATIQAKENALIQVRLPSGEIRNFNENCYATIGQISNQDHMNMVIGSAGRKRWMGWRPHVRGVAMNPIDHPLGGGEGKTSGGRHPCSPWGQKAKGLKTRKRKKTSNKFIVKRRNSK
ncbi:MAG: 50S ribosomal protein L2 [Chitinivibrionales bacterium]|nr:50S ribosomal protein L2 [Chitinivibrionales bacterium]